MSDETATTRPSPPLALLTPMERAAYRSADFFVRRMRPLARLWNSTFMLGLTTLASSRRLRVTGLEHLQAYGARDRLIFVANHRSFFDFFQIMNVVWRRTRLGRRVLFPVRSTFFYDHPLGPLVNLAMSGMSMFPPILRRRSALPFNELALDRCAEELALPGTLVGIHPEGKRNKEPDPYTLLRATRGVGRVALACPDVPVVPVFALGASNDLLGELGNNLFARQPRPLWVVFGPPVDLSDLAPRAGDPVAWKEAARRCIEAIEALGRVQRALAAQEDADGVRQSLK